MFKGTEILAQRHENSYRNARKLNLDARNLTQKPVWGKDTVKELRYQNKINDFLLFQFQFSGRRWTDSGLIDTIYQIHS